MVCVWKGREGGCIYGMGEVCVHGERVCVCIWKGWSVRALGEGECVYGRGGVCVHGERNDACIWKGWSVCARKFGTKLSDLILSLQICVWLTRLCLSKL